MKIIFLDDPENVGVHCTAGESIKCNKQMWNKRHFEKVTPTSDRQQQKVLEGERKVSQKAGCSIHFSVPMYLCIHHISFSLMTRSFLSFSCFNFFVVSFRDLCLKRSLSQLSVFFVSNKFFKPSKLSRSDEKRRPLRLKHVCTSGYLRFLASSVD